MLISTWNLTQAHISIWAAASSYCWTGPKLDPLADLHWYTLLSLAYSPHYISPSIQKQNHSRFFRGFHILVLLKIDFSNFITKIQIMSSESLDSCQYYFLSLLPQIDPFRSSLSPKTVEGLVCLKNWLSSSNQSIIVKEYMDEAETLDLSVQIESGKIKF